MRLLKGKRKKSEMSLEITPLIDMVFLLLIFFLIATSFDNFKKMNVTLPSSQTGEKVKQQTVSIYITKENEIFYEDQQVSIKQLNDFVLKLDKENISTIFINGDQDVSYKMIIDIMDILRKNGLYNISLGVKSY